VSGTSTTTNIWHAACAAYAYGIECVIGLDDSENGRTTEILLSVPELDMKEIVNEYISGKFALTSAKHLVDAFHDIRNMQGDMRRRGESSWRATAWVNGKIG
jgi:hypothetical protein